MKRVDRPAWPYPMGTPLDRRARVSLYPDGTLDELLLDVGDYTFGLSVISVEDEAGVVSARVHGDDPELPEPYTRLTVTFFVSAVEVHDPRVEEAA